MSRDLLRLHPALRRHLREPSERDAVDLVSVDGHWGVELAENLRGVRDLSAHALTLARWVADRPSRNAALVVVSPQITPQMESEWAEIQKVLRRDVAQRISLVGHGHPLARRPGWIEPLLDALRAPGAASPPSRAEAPAPPTAKLFDVVKLLLNRWLRKEGPVRVMALADQAGCSYPTLYKALARLDRYGELARTSRRSVMLKEFPQRTWSEFLALLPTLRQTGAFIDASGRSFAPDWFLSRLKQWMPPRVALGGVQAARHWHPEFNLNGVPRIDLVLHAPDADGGDLSFVDALDPALKRISATDPRHAHQVVLAVHRLARRVPLFDPDPRKGLPFADPVETLLDLQDLRLVGPADELVRFLTGRRRGA